MPLAVIAVGAAPGASLAWGNRNTHLRLTDAAVGRYAELDAFLRDQYGLPEGLATALAVQPGFGPDALDDDIEPGGPPHASRFIRSWNLIEESRVFRPAPLAARITLAERCADPLDDGCFAALPRQDVSQLLRAGAWAEDNPNLRASHHFHDPAMVHGEPAGNRGLDNSGNSVLGWIRDQLVGLGTRLFRGGTDFDLTGRSARDRALNLPLGDDFPSAAEPDNFFSLADAESHLFRALTAEGRDEREHAMALHFLAVGSVRTYPGA